MAKLKKWWEIYHAGTQAGDEEKRFFVAIARHPTYKYRSVGAIAQETGLTKTRCEEIISKYHPKGLLLQNSKHPDQWGYWETLGIDANTGNPPVSVSEADKEARITKAVGKKP
jgi:hypothetical protein